MKLLRRAFYAFLIIALVSPGSATPHSDLECQHQRGLCLHGDCPSPWHSIGTCNIEEHKCCRRWGRRPRVTMKKEDGSQ